MKVDYIIVGLGIAGICFTKQLLDHNKRFMVIADACPGATQNSGGVFNPIVLRRFTAPENTVKYTEYALKLYDALQRFTGDSWLHRDEKAHRIFASIEEQNNWFAAADKPHLKPYITPYITPNTNPFVVAEFGLGVVSNSFRIDSFTFTNSLHKYFLSNQKLIEENFNYNDLISQSGDYPWRYKNIQTKAILFAEGTRVVDNPFLNTRVIRPNKGEYIIIKAPSLKLNYMLKGGVYIIPLGSDRYKVGATYSHENSSNHPTEAARIEIENTLNKMIACDYKVENQIAGTRPVTKDRQPILGELRKAMYIFNGLGSRGFTRGPYYSKILYDAINTNNTVPAKIDVRRFIS